MTEAVEGREGDREGGAADVAGDLGTEATCEGAEAVEGFDAGVSGSGDSSIVMTM